MRIVLEHLMLTTYALEIYLRIMLEKLVKTVLRITLEVYLEMMFRYMIEEHHLESIVINDQGTSSLKHCNK